MNVSAPALPRVLVVDDCPDAARCLGMLLSCWGHEVELASNGSGALNALPWFRPDVVVLDLSLPDMDGWTLASRIRGRTDAEQLLLVAMSGWGDERDRQRSLESGCDVHLVKPVEPNRLQALLSTPRPTRGMQPWKMLRLLTSLDSAALLVEALNAGRLQNERWDLSNWSYEAIPWGVRFLRHNDEGDVLAAVTALAVPATRRLEFREMHASPWPTELLFFG